MTAFSNVFRSEVMRMARKEIKGELSSLRKAVTAQRSEIAAFKRDIKALESQVKALQKGGAQQAGASAKVVRTVKSADETPARRSKRHVEFKAEALAAKRSALGISQQAMAALLEASTLSVHKWESGKAKPRAAQLARIQEVLKLGKREALAKLQA